MRDREVMEESDAVADLTSGNSTRGSLFRALLQSPYSAHVRVRVDTYHPGRGNHSRQCQSTALMTHRQLYGLIQVSTGHLKSPRVLLPAPIMSTYEPRKKEEGEVC